jgi:hypothetical protein
VEITKEWLLEKKACSEGTEWFLNQKESDAEKVIENLLRENHFNWANWALTKLMTVRQCRQYAIFAAEQVLEIFEKQYPDDKRPRLAIEAAKAVMENNTEENRRAADAAAYAANAAANAANAAYAAYAANAAANAAYAAYAAAYAADAAAYAANAAYAAYAEMKKIIIEYGISIIRGAK